MSGNREGFDVVNILKLERISVSDYKSKTDGLDGGKALVIRAIVTAYHDAAKAVLLDVSPALAELEWQKREELNAALLGRPSE